LFQRKENKLPKLLGATDKDPTELFACGVIKLLLC